MHIKFGNDQQILNYYLPKLKKRLRHITKIDMTYVPPSVLRDINKNRLTDVRSLQWT